MGQAPDDPLSRDGQLRDLIIAAIQEGVVAIDAAGRFVFANDAAARIGGYPSAEAMMASRRPEFLSRVRISDLDGVPIAVDQLPSSRAFAGAFAEGTVRLQSTRGGEERWVHFAATPVKRGDGAVELIVCVVRDVTESQRLADGQRFLAGASAVLGSSLDYGATLRAVAQLAVPRLRRLVHRRHARRRSASEQARGRARRSQEGRVRAASWNARWPRRR